MCGPVASAAVGIAGAVVSGIGRAKQIEAASKQEKKAAEHQAREYLRQGRYAAKDIRRQAKSTAYDFLVQASIHDRQKVLERVRGSYNAARLGEQGKRVLGGQVAAFGSSGIAIEGTIADVVRSTGEEVAKDIAATRFSTRIASENEAILADVNRKNARRAIRQGEASAKDALKYAEEAAKDTRKMGVTAGAAIRSGAGISIAAPVISQVGTMISSGVFSQ